MVAYNVFRTESGDLVILASPTDLADSRVFVVAAEDLEQFYAKLSGARPESFRQSTRPIPPAGQEQGA